MQEGVTIGATNGKKEAALIGDNCFIGSGAKIIGNIRIGNNVAIGAGAVVVKDCLEDSVTLAGVPAKIVSHNGSASNLPPFQQTNQ
ncbi:serine O-acetyltransferase [Lacticaseibacillus jixianensis]|uniref:Serine O-acetyltransferase n=1 Tax=Lacticaseibacillus jixianensis TaxID=2486012 RepID=A0ABW4B9U5_9LACO